MSKKFLVGGAVRDQLLGKDPKDLDYVVVGSSISEMLSQGFKQVGEAFPVFLHPETNEEYALARREKKTAPGYKGFEFEFDKHVTIEDDLLRRDLTINSIAFDAETQEYIDPYNGIEDLKNKILRHTSIAFAEDPLRVLRIARFAARYEFDIAPETVELCELLVKSGEIDALSADRVWAELEKLFSEARPSIGLLFLEKIGALETPRLKNLMFAPVINYKALYKFDVEPTLSSAEKMFFSLNLQYLSKDQIEQFRVPVHAVRFSRFFSKVYDLIMNHVEDVFFPRMVVPVFDSFREEFKAGKLQEVINLVFKLVDEDHYDIFPFLNRLEKSIKDLLSLNFTESTKSLKTNEIKNFVLQTKIEVVEKSFR